MRRTLSLVVALAAVGVGSASAQGTSGSINATAQVVAALTVNGTDLVFGNIAPTSFKTVAPASGGTFTVTGAASQPVSVSFALPANLGNAAVAIGSWTGLSNTSNTTAGAAALTPSASAQTLSLSGTGSLYLWVGATVTTTAASVGSYSAPVTLTVVYN
ncbi:MAG TPA: hypothetical protein VJ847_10635 [Gemmatimonadales bacterium]|jgi:hypothetical protein|nr:hypothetical protein [Gemmatimonadales bacterium]